MQAMFASDLFYIIILLLSKASCEFFIIWLTPYKTHKKIVWVLFGASVVWATTSLSVEAFRYPTDHA